VSARGGGRRWSGSAGKEFDEGCRNLALACDDGDWLVAFDPVADDPDVYRHGGNATPVSVSDEDLLRDIKDHNVAAIGFRQAARIKM